MCPQSFLSKAIQVFSFDLLIITATFNIRTHIEKSHLSLRIYAPISLESLLDFFPTFNFLFDMAILSSVSNMKVSFSKSSKSLYFILKSASCLQIMFNLTFLKHSNSPWPIRKVISATRNLKTPF